MAISKTARELKRLAENTYGLVDVTFEHNKRSSIMKARRVADNRLITVRFSGASHAAGFNGNIHIIKAAINRQLC